MSTCSHFWFMDANLGSCSLKVKNANCKNGSIISQWRMNDQVWIVDYFVSFLTLYRLIPICLRVFPMHVDWCYVITSLGCVVRTIIQNWKLLLQQTKQIYTMRIFNFIFITSSLKNKYKLFHDGLMTTNFKAHCPSLNFLPFCY